MEKSELEARRAANIAARESARRSHSMMSLREKSEAWNTGDVARQAKMHTFALEKYTSEIERLKAKAHMSGETQHLNGVREQRIQERNTNWFKVHTSSVLSMLEHEKEERLKREAEVRELHEEKQKHFNKFVTGSNDQQGKISELEAKRAENIRRRDAARESLEKAKAIKIRQSFDNDILQRHYRR